MLLAVFCLWMWEDGDAVVCLVTQCGETQLLDTDGKRLVDVGFDIGMAFLFGNCLALFYNIGCLLSFLILGK